MADVQQYPDAASAEELLSIEDRPLVPVALPEWQKTVYVRPISAGEIAEIEWQTFEANRKEDTDDIRSTFMRQRENLIVRTVCKKDGTPLFTKEQIPELSKKRASVITTLWLRIQEINLLSPESIEALAKNSESAPSEDSNVS